MLTCGTWLTSKSGITVDQCSSHSKEHLWCKGKFSRGRKEIGEERESKTARRLTQITPVFRETNQQFSKKTTTVACFFLIIEREEIASCEKKLKLIRKRES